MSRGSNWGGERDVALDLIGEIAQIIHHVVWVHGHVNVGDLQHIERLAKHVKGDAADELLAVSIRRCSLSIKLPTGTSTFGENSGATGLRT